MCEGISYSFIGFGFCSVLGKTAVLVRFVVTGFGFFLISRRNVILSLRLRAVDLLPWLIARQLRPVFFAVSYEYIIASRRWQY